jgi:predicted RNase H-like nuclease (RuvC/YqgF family)
MRFSCVIWFLATAALLSPISKARAQEENYAEARAAARRDLMLAKMELRQYQLVEYPRLRRHLQAQIDLTEAEIRDYKERLHEYRSFDRFSVGRPFMVTLQELRMCLLEAELRQRDLWAERNALIRFHSDDWRLLEMRVHEARLRVAEIEAAHEAVAAAELPSPAE